MPDDAQVRLAAIGKIRSVFTLFGFLPLETPTLEYADVLTGKYGDEGEKLMYRFKDQGDRDVAMRYDLTVPLARVVAQYAELPKPFRRYQIAPVWRAENTQKGRYRELVQCDVDIIGTKSRLADVEVMQAISMVLEKLGIVSYTILYSNRKIWDGLLATIGLDTDEKIRFLRILDKWNKIGENGVRAEAEAELGKEKTDKLMKHLPQSEDSAAWLTRVRKQTESFAVGTSGVNELQEVEQFIRGLPNAKKFSLDPYLTRGLDYYTGTVFEIVLPEKKDFGSVAGGGRYDGLIGRFTGKDMPAVGMSVGLDRLLVAMSELGLEQGSQSSAKVFVALLDESLRSETFQLVNGLRQAGIATEMSYEAAKLDKQLTYADKLGFRFAMLYGKKEQGAGTVVLKDLEKREQREVERSNIMNELKKALS